MSDGKNWVVHNPSSLNDSWKIKLRKHKIKMKIFILVLYATKIKQNKQQ